MKKVIKILIIVLIILMLAISGVFAYLYLCTDMLKTNKQMYLKYLSESKDLIYNQLKDEDLDAYKKKLKNTPYESNGKISIKYDTENSSKTKEMKLAEKSDITISGKVDQVNKINLQNIKVNYPQSESIDIDILAQNDMYGFKINNILKKYIVVENNNLQEWAKVLGLNEDQIKMIPNKLDSTYTDAIISEDELNKLIEKYTKLGINSLNNDMFSKTLQDNLMVYSLKINETQLKKIVRDVLETAKNDEDIWQIVRKIFINLSIYSEEEVNNKIDKLKQELDEYIDDLNNENIDGNDIYGNTVTDTSKEDKIYVYNLYIENGKLIKIEDINDDISQTISKTENGIMIEKKDTYLYEPEVTTFILEKKKEEDKLIYSLEKTENSELVGTLTIGYRGLGNLDQVEEVAVLEVKSDLESEKGILQRAEESNKQIKSNEEEEKIKIAINELLMGKFQNIYPNSDITLIDLKNLFIDKNFEISQIEDGTFKIISKDTMNEYTITSNGNVTTKKAEIQENIEEINSKRKIQYFNKNTFNENLQIKKIEDNEIWKMNGKDAKQIENVYESISTKMEELNKQNSSSYKNISTLSLGLVPYFSIVGIDNIEFEELTYKDIASLYAGTAVGVIGVGIYVYNSALNSIRNANLQQEMNQLDR